MKKRIKKKIKKLKKSINKINKVRVQKGRKAMLQETWATVTYGLYDNRKIRRLKKFPPALVENRMLFETNDDFTDNGRALFDYLIEKGYNKKYEIVWLVHEPSKYKEYQFENVKFVQNFKNGSTIRRAEAYKYIFEYIPNKYSVTDENLRSSDAIEIKIGQGTKPGMGGHLPGEKVTDQIAEIRGKKQGEDIQSPSKFPEINSKEDLKDMVSMLRRRSEGRPIGIKIAAGRIEKDLEHCVFAEPDFITIDGRGGATGSSPYMLREATTVPTVYALYRARKYLDSVDSDISLVITGGLRVSADFAKALAMGADAVAIASAGLMAAACQQYKICGTGNCPVGIATQNEDLRNRLKVDAAAQRVANFLNVSREELKMFARITGNKSVHDLSTDDLVTVNHEISRYTNISHA